MEKVYSIKLTLEELRILDGKVSSKAQEIIDKAKEENSFGFGLPLMNEILSESSKTGELTWKYKNIRSCPYCDKKYDYAVYPRSSRYHRKGDKNFDKPKYYRGLAFNEGFVTIEGSGDICVDCANKHNLINGLIDYIIDNDLKIQIQKNDHKNSKYLKDNIRECYQCKEEMLESTMKRKDNLMMNGTYPSICPKCGAEATIFGKSHKITNKFNMIPNLAFGKDVHVKDIKNMVFNFNEIADEENRLNFFELNKSPNVFAIELKKWQNGRERVLTFSTIESFYKKGFVFNKDKHDIFEEYLKNNGYELL